MLRFVGSLKLRWVTASLAIQKLQASVRKSELAKAIQEYGRLIKTIHILGWYECEEKRRWANRPLNKGEALHGLKAYLSVGNRGVLRRKTDEQFTASDRLSEFAHKGHHLVEQRLHVGSPETIKERRVSG